MWDFTKWFGNECSDSLPPRLGVLAFGLIVLIVCGYFAEKGRPLNQASAARSAVGSREAHNVYSTPNKGYFCGTCSFTTTDASAASSHRGAIRRGAPATKDTGSRPSVHTLDRQPKVNASGFDIPPKVPAAAVSEPAPALPAEYKACLDCAEQVRYAARKCRFCGFMFEDQTTSA